MRLDAPVSKYPALLSLAAAAGVVLLGAVIERPARATEASSAYASAVEGDAPVAWWRMSPVEGRRVANQCAVDGAAEVLAAEVVGKIRFDVAGPRGEQFPDFAADNVAARLEFGRAR